MYMLIFLIEDGLVLRAPQDGFSQTAGSTNSSGGSLVVLKRQQR